MKLLMRSLLAVAAMTAASAGSTQAAFLPVGVQNDVSFNTVTTTWGWSVAYQGNYNVYGLNISDLFANATGTHVMLAAKKKGSDTFEVLAAALKSDVTTHTAWNVTHTANGVNWYYNGGSMGFAGAGDTIYQNSADINGSYWSGQADERDRLSWHTGGSNGYDDVPLYLNGGWRAGANVALNDSTEWERFVLTADLVEETPAPPALILGVIGVASMLGVGRFRRKATPAIA